MDGLRKHIKWVDTNSESKKENCLPTILIAKPIMYICIFQSRYECGNSITPRNETKEKVMLGNDEEGQNSDKILHKLWKTNSCFSLVSTLPGYFYGG